jgi:hypothetical protein
MSPLDRFARRTHVGLMMIAIIASALVFVTGAPAGASGVTRSSGQLASQVEADTTTSLLPLPPCRLFDARHTPDRGRIDADTWRLRVIDRCGVPASARAVSISLVATGTTDAGFVTVHPDGTARPDASNLNYERGNTVANSAVVKLGTSGSIDVFTSVPADIIVDVTGAFVDAPAAVSAGRFVGVDPRRVVDTRLSGERGDTEIRVPIPAGVPRDASALAVSVTAVGAAASGFLSVYPAGGARTETSVVNTDEHNDTRANAVFVSVGADGFVVFRSMETDVLVDVWGWFTGPSAPSSTDGLFVPQPPQRAWDSRLSFDPIHRGGTVEKQLLDVSAAAAIVANVTVVEPTGWGFVSVFAAGTPMPDVSSLNYRWRQPVAALTVSRVSDRGVALYSYAGAHAIVDVAGWFTGIAAPGSTPRPVNDFPAGDSDVLMISDSAFAGIRWTGPLSLLQGAAWDARLESCRRLIGVSCRGREGYAPPTAVTELSTVPAGVYRILFVATGYNDWSGLFPSGVEAVMSRARAKGIDRVVWLTYREQVGYVSPGGVSNQQSFAANNRHLVSVLASGRYPELIIADWNSYSRWRPSWLTADGVHLTAVGAPEAARYLSRKLAFLERRPCPGDITGPTTPGGWCADPDVTGPPG